MFEYSGQINSLANQTIDCSCGHKHTVPIRTMITGSGVLSGLKSILEAFTGQKVFVIGDNNTLPLALDRVSAMLQSAGCSMHSYQITADEKNDLVVDQYLIGKMLVHMPPDTQLIITIGSGAMNDTSRVISHYCHIPYIIIGTAPSMDGYASSTSAVVMDGGKKSLSLGTPYAIIGDVDLIKTAPDIMLAAGAGDILGKFIAMRDWMLAEQENGEYFCPNIADMIISAAQRCVANLDQLFSRDDKIMQDTMDSLIMSGVAISMYGISRPAAGAEHQIAHYWEVDGIRNNRKNMLHGNYVGLGTWVASRLYELVDQDIELRGKDIMPSSEQIGLYLKKLHGYSSFEKMGISRELFREALFHAAGPEVRYTILSYLRQIGKLEYYIDLLIESFSEFFK